LPGYRHGEPGEDIQSAFTVSRPIFHSCRPSGLLLTRRIATGCDDHAIRIGVFALCKVGVRNSSLGAPITVCARHVLRRLPQLPLAWDFLARNLPKSFRVRRALTGEPSRVCVRSGCGGHHIVCSLGAGTHLITTPGASAPRRTPVLTPQKALLLEVGSAKVRGELRSELGATVVRFAVVCLSGSLTDYGTRLPTQP
jgi:hypothetical protein